MMPFSHFTDGNREAQRSPQLEVSEPDGARVSGLRRPPGWGEEVASVRGD